LQFLQNIQGFPKDNYLRCRLASGEGIVMLGVCVCVCVCVTRDCTPC